MDKKRAWIVTISSALGLVIVGLIVAVLFKASSVGEWIKDMLGILSPFFIGGVIAYILRPLCNIFDRWIKKGLFKLCKRQPTARKERVLNKTAHVASIVITYVVMICFVGGLLWMIIPQISETIVELIRIAPELVDKVVARMDIWFVDFPQILDKIHSFLENFEEWFIDFLTGLIMSEDSDIVGGIFQGVSSVFTVATTILVAFVVSLNLLAGRKIFGPQAKMIIYALFKTETADKIMDEVAYADKSFTGFMVGRTLDSIIIGVLTYLFMLITDMPYKAMISLVVGATNFVPFYGPFIGGVPSALLIFLVNPMQGIVFAVFTVALQQLDGNILDPIIVGDRVGLRGVWVLFAVTVFGGLFGFWGMLFGVPTFSVIYDIVRKLVKKGLKKNGKDHMYEDYEEVFARASDGKTVYKKTEATAECDEQQDSTQTEEEVKGEE